MSPQDLAKHIGDRLWRLKHLYSIKDAETGAVINFVPRREQELIFDCLLAGVRKLIILKARRLGIGPGLGVWTADEVAFCQGVQCSIVDQTEDHATKKLVNIVRVAYDNLPQVLRDRMDVKRANDSSLEISSKTGDTISAVYAGKNARGGTNQFLHISEWGVIQADDPKRSEEILTGALPSAEHGVTVVESTWKGGRGGHLWKIVKDAMELPPEKRGLNDWHLFFFPWWVDPTYSEPGDESAIEPEVSRYLNEKEEELGRQFSSGQRCWYARRKKTLGIFIYREFPTTIDECFRSPIEGAIYADLIDKLRGAGAIRKAEVDGTSLVHTCWDLGSPINTVTWYFQICGPELRVIDLDIDLDLTPVQRVARLFAKNYNYGYHFMPHDVMATQKSGKTFLTELAEIGLHHVRCVPQTHDIWIGINRLRQLMPRFTFRVPQCERGIEALSCYHTRRETSSGTASDIPVHDWSSHPADALRILAEAEAAGMLSNLSSKTRTTIIRTGFRGDRREAKPSILDIWFSPGPARRTKIIR